jgi:outer membrane protein
MRKTVVATALAAALAAGALPLGAQQQPPPLSGKLGFVNTERILRDAVPAQRAQKKIEAEFQKRDQELAKIAGDLKRMQDDLDKNSMTMGEAQRRNREREFADLNRDFQRKQREFREDLNQRRNEELAQVVELANRVIRQIAEQEKFDIIFQDAVFASPRIDITDKVIKALDSGKSPRASAAAWPATPPPGCARSARSTMPPPARSASSPIRGTRRSSPPPVPQP